MGEVKQEFRQRNRTPNQNNSHVQFNIDSNNNSVDDNVFNDLDDSPSSSVPQSAPAPSVSVSKAAAESRKYWVKNFFAVLAPFVLLGLPIHVILWSRKRGTGDKIREELDENTWAYWLEFRFHTKPIAALTLLLLPIWMVLNAYAFQRIYKLFDHLVIQGAITDEDYLNILTLVYMSPFLALLNYSWIYGHSLNRLIKNFGRPVTVLAYPSSVNTSQRLLSINDDPRQTDSTESEASYELNTDPDPDKHRLKGSNVLSILTDVKVSSFRVDMAITYLLTFATYVLHFFVTQHRSKIESWGDDRISDHWKNYIYTVTYTLMLPVYQCFCGAILCKLHSLNRFIERMIHRGQKMQLAHVYLIKKAYKIIADSIVHVNLFCRVFLAWLLVVLYFSSGIRASGLISFLVERISYAFREAWPETPSNGTLATDTGENETLVGSDDVGVPPDLVRFYVGVGIESLLYIYLMRSTVWEAIHVNDECRYLQVRLNDLASELASNTGFSAPHADSYHSKLGKQYYVDADVYRAFKLLKLYVHSRMETHAEKQQALLNILGIIAILPGMPLINRISGYNLIH